GPATATAYSTPAITARPSAQASTPAGSVVIGGGFAAFADATSSVVLLGQFATISAPQTNGYHQCGRLTLNGFQCQYVPTAVVGWVAESKDHVIPARGRITTQAMAMPPTITVAGRTFNVQSRYVYATSGPGAHPAVDVSGLRGE